MPVPGSYWVEDASHPYHASTDTHRSHIIAGVTDASIAEHFAPHVNDVQLVAKLLEEALSDTLVAPQATK